MPDGNMNPNEQLGLVVTEALASEGLVVPDDKEDILSKLCNGRMTSDEWKLCVEKKILKDEGELDNGESSQEN